MVSWKSECATRWDKRQTQKNIDTEERKVDQRMENRNRGKRDLEVQIAVTTDTKTRESSVFCF